MYILTNENRTFNLNSIPDSIDDIRYCILDCNDEEYIDYFFVPLIFLESFHAPSVLLKIGPYNVQMPLDWSILVCDNEMTDVEILPIASLNDRGFKTILMNPLNSKMPHIVDVEIENIYSETKWFFPKLKNNNMLIMPLEQKDDPMCGFFVREGNKISNILTVGNLF